MTATRRLPCLVVLCLFFIASCGDQSLLGSPDDDAGTEADAGPEDAGMGGDDAGPDGGDDAGEPDAGPGDAGPTDAGPADGGPPDSGPPDSGPPDSGPPDSGPPDSGPPDAGPTCGDGFVASSEACDDGDLIAGDGCSDTCAVEAGWLCAGSPSLCTAAMCGDGIVAGAEGCDDGGTTSGDGCSDVCVAEPGFTCTGNPSTCVTTCGDGTIAGAETCDDANTMAGDGCSATCAPEPGFTCMGSPSTCATTCGDGVPAGTEACDDGDMSDLDCCSTTCMRLCTEVEDNGTSATANPIMAGAPVTGGIDPAADVDFWVLTLTGPSNVRIETFDASGSACAGIDTVIELRGSDGTTVLISDDDDGINNCSLINPTTDAVVRSLPAGTYYIRVRAFDATAVIDRYTLSVTTTAAGCGDGFAVAPEECDDGNTMSGDGCSATCAREPRCGDGFLDAGEACDDGDMSDLDCCSTACMRLCTEMENNGTAATANPITPGTPVNASIDPAGDIDFWVFTLAAPSNVRIETFDGSGTACSGIDTVIELRAGDGTTIIDSDDDSGINACSLLNHPTDVPLRNLAAGTYYVRVRAFSGTATIDRYTLAITATPAGCGDTYVFAPEECDDGNTMSGDGCSASCTFESLCGNGMPNPGEACDDGDASNADCCSTTCTDLCTETESNGTSATANPLTVGTPVTGGIDPAADVDFWSFTLTAPSNVRLETFDASGTDCVAINTTMELRAPDGTTILITDFDDGINLCSLIDHTVDTAARSLAAGTYFVLVRASSATAVIDRYTLAVTATPAGCGDGYVIAPEQCEDGNTMSGDGCSATCMLESPCGNGMLDAGEACDDGDFRNDDCCSSTCTRLCTEMEPNNTFATANPLTSNVAVTGAIDPAADADFWAITLTAPGDIRVETFDRTGAACTGINTTVELRGTDGTTILITDTDDGMGTCSLIDPVVDAAARARPAGTYYVRVVASSATAVIDRYTLLVGVSTTCGDGTRGFSEQCDDGNTISSDGCSMLCTLDSPVVPETEPNEDGTPSTGATGIAGNDFSSAMANGPFATSVRLSGAITPAGDEDVYAFTNPGGMAVRLRLRTNTDMLGTACVGADTGINVRDAAGMLLASDDDDGVNACSQLWFSLAPGATVYVHITEFGDNATIASYFVIAEYL